MKILGPMSDANPCRTRKRQPRSGKQRRRWMIPPALVLLLGLVSTDARTILLQREVPNAAAHATEGAVVRPVLLVPGWLDRGADLEPMRERLIEAGWPEDRVAVMDFEDPVASNVVHAVEVSRAVAELRLRAGAERVDVVAHSMGGLAVRHYLLFLGGHDFTRSVVFLGTPHRGTLAAHLAWGEGGAEMVPGSDFLMKLNERGTVPDGIRAKTIRTPLDLRVLPMTSATLPGARDIEVCCPSHAGLLHDVETFEAIRDFLERG